MKYEQFLQSIFDLVSKEGKSEIGILRDDCHSKIEGVWIRHNPDPEKDYIIYVQWETGGVSGGGYWHDANPEPYTTNETEPDFTILDSIIENYAVDMTFTQYRKLENSLKEVTDYTDSLDYYGNCTDYGLIYINIRKLYDYLVENNFINSYA